MQVWAGNVKNWHVNTWDSLNCCQDWKVEIVASEKGPVKLSIHLKIAPKFNAFATVLKIFEKYLPKNLNLIWTKIEPLHRYFYFFWTNCKKLFSQHFMMSYQESVWPRSVSFNGHSKRSFHKNCSSSCYSWRVWHMTWLMYSNQHS